MKPKSIPLFIFEDPGWRRFGPLTSIRPVWDLRLGLETLGERICQSLNKTPNGWIPRESLIPLVHEKYGSNATELPEKGEVLIVNGRSTGTLPKDGFALDYPWSVWTDGPDVVMARMPVEIARKWLSQPNFDPADFSARTLLTVWSMEKTAPEIRIIEMENVLAFWPWELIHLQERAIEDDFSRFIVPEISGHVSSSAILTDEHRIHISKGASVGSGAILDATNGPIILQDGVKVFPGAIIMGPVVIGQNSTVKAGAKLYGPLSIGPVCKVGGEIEDTIIQGYSNKQHEGFLGHAVLGEWVNLGADTNNSDLKNNYGKVKVIIDGENIDTGETFVGSIIGDHVKTGINTMLNTGTVIGVGSMIYGAGFPPKHIAPFKWGGADGFVDYDFDKFISTARVVAGRRDQEISPATAALLHQLHQQSTNS